MRNWKATGSCVTSFSGYKTSQLEEEDGNDVRGYDNAKRKARNNEEWGGNVQ